MKLNFAQEIQSVGLLAPIQITATATSSAYIEMAKVGAGWVEFDAFFGVVTSTDSTGELCVTVESSTSGASTDTNTQVAFYYRLSGAVGTDTLGTITLADSTGYMTGNNTFDGMRLLVYVDPAVVADKAARLTLTPSTDFTVCNVSVTGRFIPRYAQNALIDAVST